MGGGRKSRPLVVDNVEIDRHHLAYVEAELRMYPARKRSLAFMEQTAAWSAGQMEPGMPHGGGAGDPTGERAIRLASNPEREWLSVWVRTVEDTFHSLPIEQQQVVKRLCFERRLTPEGVAQELNMHLATVYRIRNRALLQFAVVLLGPHVAKNLRKTGVD